LGTIQRKPREVQGYADPGMATAPGVLVAVHRARKSFEKWRNRDVSSIAERRIAVRRDF